MMKAIDAVDLHVGIDGERNTIETFLTVYTTEALSMVRFTRRPEDLAEKDIQLTIELRTDAQ